MKTKNILLLIFSVLALTACNDFLNTDDLTRKNSANFPKTESDAQQSLAGCYAMLRYQTSGNEAQNQMIVSEILSDDRFAGGGPDDAFLHAVDHLSKYGNNMFEEIWKDCYAGIHRCNMLIESIPNISFSSNDSRNQIDGEARFLRAYYYFCLCETFGNVPLITTSLSKEDPPQATPEQLYSQIGNDLTTAIKDLPTTKAPDIPASQLGHATRWAAEGMLARVFLFYTGYYSQTSLPAPDKGAVTKDEVITDLKDCIDNSGHKLMPDFRNLWPYSNSYTKPNYPYSMANDLNWYGEDGGNLETIFSIRYSAKASWDDQSSWRSNQVDLFFSPRESDGSVENNFPLGIGWGAGTISPKMIEEWETAEPKDIRLKASVFDVSEEAPNYVWGADKQQDETGYWEKKYCAINVKTVQDGDTIYENFARRIYPDLSTDYQLNNIQDIVVLRYADILLMYSELTHTTGGINQVRARVHLAPVANYTDAALRNERHWELAFEGLRWYDLLRWHIAADALQKEDGTDVEENGVKTKIDMSDIGQRVKDTGGFMQIPQTQIDLSNGVLKQNKGW
ncbi:MAG: RagB/SusD family nutrient uptake outer membrane protein [Prevotella sp.]|jgi:hypothetical protein|nr:RagB/SusD family nutrient uptake outer membrane protein [Prevotella sp.]MCH4250903.1 RagB/SusD family nutrient uptake outer membrane protein [Prevotella sp.]MCI1685994.1 RagB/SusD family nutrient uptake outer membrane protein [Prevotella sp.]MCI1781743.1 RagB/SusD family nutrient uptake outer membrane protein [Prevotella sp.]MCI1817241.1 RagB/SusD family nutrient uptake outer membrane protein [Prevotella sp.]